MAEKKDKKQAAPAAEKPEGSPQAPQVGDGLAILAQYVRDISFENPNAPESLRTGKRAPEMDINIGMDARKIEDENIPNMYEVVLNARAEAKRGDEIVFIAEVFYGVTVAIGDSIPVENHHPVLLIEMPRQVFPYVRQILSDLTTQGGYPPLLLNPVDFQALYMQRFGAEMEEARKELEKTLRADIAKDSDKPN